MPFVIKNNSKCMTQSETACVFRIFNVSSLYFDFSIVFKFMAQDFFYKIKYPKQSRMLLRLINTDY